MLQIWLYYSYLFCQRSARYLECMVMTNQIGRLLDSELAIVVALSTERTGCQLWNIAL